MFFQNLFRVNRLVREQSARNRRPVFVHILAKELIIKRIVNVAVESFTNVRVRVIKLLFGLYDLPEQLWVLLKIAQSVLICKRTTNATQSAFNVELPPPS